MNSTRLVLWMIAGTALSVMVCPQQASGLKRDGKPGAARAQAKVSRNRRKKSMLVAYDAKDKRYYSVAWAKAHHMKDRGGDTLVLIRKSRLPKDAKMSRAMHGKM